MNNLQFSVPSHFSQTIITVLLYSIFSVLPVFSFSSPSASTWTVCLSEKKMKWMSICLNLKVRRWKEGAGRVRISLFSLWSLVRSPDEITSSCNITSLTQHQLIVLFSSFLLLSCHLLDSSVTFSSSAALGMHSQWIQPQVLHVAAIFYSPACFFLSTVFSPCVLCCWWATAKTLIPNTVWVRVHTRGAFTHPHPSDPLAKRKIFPWAMALSSFCACVWACEWERRGKRAVMANTKHRYWSKVRTFGKKWQLAHHT